MATALFTFTFTGIVGTRDVPAPRQHRLADRAAGAAQPPSSLRSSAHGRIPIARPTALALILARRHHLRGRLHARQRGAGLRRPAFHDNPRAQANVAAGGVGAVAGFGSGLTGRRGPALSVPLMVLLGFPALVSIGVSQVIQIVAAMSGTLGNLRYGTIDFGVAGRRDAGRACRRHGRGATGACRGRRGILRKVRCRCCASSSGIALVWREMGGCAMTIGLRVVARRRSAEQIEIAPGITAPRSFGDPRREHLATRRAGGLFDFSFMGCTEIERARGARVRQRAADAPPRHAAAGPHRLYAAVARVSAAC